MMINLQNRFTIWLIRAWEALRWDIHELVMPMIIFALLMAYFIPRLVGLPYASMAISFYVLWYIWNILTARLRVHIGFKLELLFATIYFALLLGCISSTVIILAT